MVPKVKFIDVGNECRFKIVRGPIKSDIKEETLLIGKNTSFDISNIESPDRSREMYYRLQCKNALWLGSHSGFCPRRSKRCVCVVFPT